MKYHINVYTAIVSGGQQLCPPVNIWPFLETCLVMPTGENVTGILETEVKDAAPKPKRAYSD